MASFDFDRYASACAYGDYAYTRAHPLPPACDPDATYAAMCDALAARNWPAAGKHAADLRAWLDMGGPGPRGIHRPSVLAWVARICEVAARKSAQRV